jgi:hypothetical protein
MLMLYESMRRLEVAGEKLFDVRGVWVGGSLPRAYVRLPSEQVERIELNTVNGEMRTL